jgi:hypothetical protein
MNKGMTYDNLFLRKEYKKGVYSSSLVLFIYLFLGSGKQGGKGGYNCFNRQTRWLPCSGLPCSGLPCSGLPCSGLPCSGLLLVTPSLVATWLVRSSDYNSTSLLKRELLRAIVVLQGGMVNLGVDA